MPALYTHYYFAKSVEEILPENIRAITKRYAEIFALGSQGPDILFYHRPMKSNPVRKRGKDLHAVSPENFFVDCAKEILLAKDTENESLYHATLSYVCGFLCHFILDVACHPYIDEHSQGTFTHGKIESELDKYMLRQNGLPVRGYNTATPIACTPLSVDVCSTILQVDKQSATRAINTIKTINGWFSCKCELFHSFAHLVLKIAKMERQFGDMFLHKKDDARFQGMGEILKEKLENARPLAKEVIQNYVENIQTTVENGALENPVFAYNYSGKKE